MAINYVQRDAIEWSALTALLKLGLGSAEMRPQPGRERSTAGREVKASEASYDGWY